MNSYGANWQSALWLFCSLKYPKYTQGRAGRYRRATEMQGETSKYEISLWCSGLFELNYYPKSPVYTDSCSPMESTPPAHKRLPPHLGLMTFIRLPDQLYQKLLSSNPATSKAHQWSFLSQACPTKAWFETLHVPAWKSSPWCPVDTPGLVGFSTVMGMKPVLL